jgi:hypothetical protein
MHGWCIVITRIASVSSRKKSKPERSFRIGMIGSTPQRWLGRVQAADEKAALKAAVVEFKVPDVLQNRLVALREG